MTFEKLMSRSFGKGNSLFWSYFSHGLKIQEVRRFLDDGGDVNHRTEEGQTLLHIAVDNCEPEIVQLLLDHGADINAKGFHGYTALHLAVDSECNTSPRDGRRATELPLTKLLIDSGANESIRDDSGEVARDFALAYGPRETALYDAISQRQK